VEIQIATLVKRALAEVYAVPVLLVGNADLVKIADAKETVYKAGFRTAICTDSDSDVEPDDGACEELLHSEPADASAQGSPDLDDIQPQTSGVRPRRDYHGTVCVQLQTRGTAHVQPGTSDAQTFHLECNFHV